MTMISSFIQALGIAVCGWATWELGGIWLFVMLAGLLLFIVGVAMEKASRERV